MAGEQALILSVPTSAEGATAAATFTFFSGDYRPPRQGRSTGSDIVHNQNGVFKYRYDNGPNVYAWQPFRIVCSDLFGGLGSATIQKANLDFLWRYTEGPLKLQAPEGVYFVDWAEQPLEYDYRTRFPANVGDKIEFQAVVQFEEGG